MTLQLLGDWIAVVADPKETKTASGLDLPEGLLFDKKPRYGTVAAVGIRRSETGEILESDVEEGDRVYFHPGHDSVWELEGEEFLFLRHHEVIGVHDTSLKAVE